MRNECFFFFTLSLRSGVIDRIHLSSILCLGGEIRFSWRCEYRLNGGSKPLYEHMIHKLLLSLDKRSQRHTSTHKFGWASFVIKVKLSDMFVH